MHIKYLLGVLVLLSFLPGCGGNSNSDAKTNFNGIVSTEPAPEPDPEPDPEGPNFARGSLGDNDTVPAIHCTETVASIGALEDAVSYDMAPGTTVCLAAGEYRNLELQFGGVGSPEAPITVAAERSGTVTVTGEVSVNMSGEYVVLQGLIFKDGYAANSDVIQTRGNGNIPCNYCRITEISIIDFDVDSTESSKWINIYGSNNRVDHSWFAGKNNRGALLVVDRWLDSENGMTVDTMEQDRATIDHNYFGDRPPANGKAYADSSDNEYEAIRLGTSDSHTGDSFSVIEYNYFERIQGEAEIISNKSGNNTIRNNTVRDSHGSITTRHGSSATISGNFILGDDHPFAGGLRIVDDGHTIINNYIQGARYLDTLHHGGIVLLGADGNDTNGYQQVENVYIAHNTIVDSVNSLNVDGGGKSTNPRNIYLHNNIIASGIGPVIVQAEDGMPVNSVIGGNIFYGGTFSDSELLSSVEGIRFEDASLVEDSKGIYRPDGSVDLSAVDGLERGDFDGVVNDMDGQVRLGNTLAGADDISTDPVTSGLLSAEDVGPINYRPPMSRGFVKKVAIVNHDFDSGLDGWINNGAILTTDVGEVFSRGRSVRLDSPAASVSQSVSLNQNTNYTLSAFVKGHATLLVDLGTEIYRSDLSSTDKYKLSTLSFNSGTANSAQIFALIDDYIAEEAEIINADFTDGQYGWDVYEGVGIGQVQDSSNSASGADGSIKFKYNAEDSGSPSEPRISQTVNVVAYTDYTLSMYILEKNGSDAKVKFGVLSSDGSTVVAEKLSDYSTLSGAPKGDDSFRQDLITFNSGNNTSLTIFAEYQGSGSEVRVDDFRLTYLGQPPADTVTLFDSFRLVSHKGSE
ncbi:polysaccharide lyase 6 family protein [Microbulbifer thermotolerans]|uniref:Polysaccharide lyase 6 family protein n=1 Tax=Microbulbifer thermotolerans TaxID=252514 RepID=A0AB35HTF7_MICTH|nr:polysaccharide lyase 6 family protein [Microbulbifer thermotolerans]MCX2800209.1 polysaccharide lyase 6 family protein [Microbulbifer thermotolerans]